jgi:hypothetical protein
MFHSGNKNHFSVGVLILMAWSVVSLIYIIVDVKANLEDMNQVRQAGIQQGAQAGVTQLVSQAMMMSQNCEVVPLVLGDRTVNLINTQCLETPASTEDSEPAVTE